MSSLEFPLALHTNFNNFLKTKRLINIVNWSKNIDNSLIDKKIRDGLPTGNVSFCYNLMLNKQRTITTSNRITTLAILRES